MYMTIEEARAELGKRWNDLGLRRKVRDYLGEIPDFLREGPRAVLGRHLASPNFEFFRFAEAARRAGLRPFCSEYLGDKFCTKNPDKLLLAKMTFFHGKGRRDGDNVTCQKIISFNKFNGKRIAKVDTLWGETFVEFHHRLLAHRLPSVGTADITGWISRMGGTPDKFWHRLLSLFVCHGILFENIHLEGHEAGFTRDIILPALARVKELFGVAPLIVPSVPVERERDPYWAWYPGEMEPEIDYLAACGSSIPWQNGTLIAENKKVGVGHA